MEVEVTFLSRRGTAVMRRAQRVSADRVQIGRGTDNEVRLTDIHVGLRAAVLVPRDNVLGIESLDNAPIEVNGATVDNATLKPGDEIRIGPYRIEVLAPPDGCDGAIQIELVQAVGAELERLNATTRIGLERTGANKRRYAWTGFLVIAVICLAAPVIVFSGGLVRPWHKDAPATGQAVPKLIGLSWDTGNFSNAHRFFAADCSTCHQGAFNRVADTACLSCHAKVGNHVMHGVDIGKVGGELAEMRCIACHTEHRGIEGSVIRTAGLCLDCHRNLGETAPHAGVLDVKGFPSGHPQFRATLVADATKGTTVRAELGTSPPPVDHPGIKFSHAAHLVTGGFPVLHYKQMVCADCHVAEPGGQGFLPITYKNQCQSCHELTFDKVSLPWPDAKVPHGDDTGVIAAVWNYYAGLALQGGETLGTPTSPSVERRGAGTPPPAAPAPPPADTQAWVTAKSAAALRTVFDDHRGCAYCHYGTGANGAFDADKILAAALPPKANPAPVVAKVSMRTRFLPEAQFDHSLHRGMTCEDCHASRQAQSSGEVLIPGKATCVKCHGIENADFRVQSTCITCHVFHRDEFGAMRMTAETAQ